MPRPAKGTIMERPNRRGGINRSLRFHANDKRRTVPLGEVSRDDAERRLAQTMADGSRPQASSTGRPRWTSATSSAKR
jgi:hypothetical protein